MENFSIAERLCDKVSKNNVKADHGDKKWKEF